MSLTKNLDRRVSLVPPSLCFGCFVLAANVALGLQFGIRLCHDLKSGESEPVESIEQLVESVHYTPKYLENETAEFVESLGFLNDAFTFERDQLSLFLRTLYDNISGEENDTNSKGDIEESEGSVVLLG